MNYIGSKTKLSGFIKDTIKQTLPSSLNNYTFCDMFAGTSAIGKAFKGEAKSVISNDLEYYSFVLAKNYIENNRPIHCDTLIKELNSLPLKKGFIYNNYSIDSNRGYFTNHNAKRIDAIRTHIEKLYKSKEIDDSIYYFLLASLLESSDKVANTASIYGAFLKRVKNSANKKLILIPAHFKITNTNNKAYNKDSNTLIKEIQADIIYLDPPYNHRQYGSNYHLLNTIATYKSFKPKGVTGLPSYNVSSYCKKRDVERSFEELIKSAKSKYIYLSYNNEGLMSKEVIKDIMSRYGKYDVVSKEYQRFKADNNRDSKADSTVEYLHVLRRK